MSDNLLGFRAHRILSDSKDKLDVCDVSYGDMSICLEVTRRKAIEVMNWLEKNERIKFVQSLSKCGVGDYLNRYVVLPWNWQRMM